jgi:hypothetical protein
VHLPATSLDLSSDQKNRLYRHYIRFKPVTPAMSTHSISPQQDQQRQDQIVHRFYIKTVEVLVEPRLSNVTGGSGGRVEHKTSGRLETGEESKKEPRIDKWASSLYSR